MNISFLVPHIENILRQVLTFKYPADGTVRFYFKTNPKLGSRDRQKIADAVFSILRNLALFRNLSQSSNKPLHQALSILGLLYHKLPLTQFDNITQSDAEWLTHISKIDRSSLKFSIQYSMPEWLYTNLIANNDLEKVTKIAQSMLLPSNLDIRVNTIKTNIDDTMSELYQQNVMAGLTKYSPNALRLDAKSSIHHNPMFENGWFEIQDEGSQILCHLLNPKRGEMVVDFCAGSGGKTLAIGAIMRSTGRIYAFDVDDKRLKKIKPRLARSGLSNVYTALIQHENDSHIKRLHKKIDRVLLDVPCSGIGTLRRNPDLKWRQSDKSIEELNVKQKSILANGAKLLKTNGIIVYATCSLLKKENEDIVEEFLANNTDFKLLPAYEILEKQKINVENIDNSSYLKLYPHIHGTDGFFAAVLQKT